MKAAELIAAFIYSGYLYTLEAKSKDSLSRMILDQMNQINSLDTEMVDIKDAFSSNLQFEKLINFSAEFNLESGEAEDIEASSLPNSA